MLTAAFLDRDGTINVKAPEGAYITDPEELVLLPGAAEAIRKLNHQGVLAILITNQRGVSRGLMSESDLQSVHQRLRDLLAAEGAHLDAIYACIHGHDECQCRKPLTGLVDQAMSDFPSITAERAAMVGDADSDVEMGRRARLTTVRLRDPGAVIPQRAPAADHESASLAQAVDWLIATTSSS
jgi:D-glycero-D-manno-heptose 1,7-bisphosphate phosphatase